MKSGKNWPKTSMQDVGFGFRQLIDVAARALSPGVNDPTTAVHVIGHLSVLLCRLVERNPGPEHLTDEHGRVRVVVSLPELKDFLDLSMNQPKQYGAADSAVAGRLLGLLQELSWCDRQRQYRTEILDHLSRMRNAVSAADYSPVERRRLLDQADSPQEQEEPMRYPAPTGRQHCPRSVPQLLDWHGQMPCRRSHC